MTDEFTTRHNRGGTGDDALSGPDDQPRPPHDALGGYLLDALPDDERLAFEQHLSECADCRQAVAELAPVVALLPLALEAELSTADAAFPAPSSDLRDRILAAARAEPGDAGLAASAGPDLTAEEAAQGVTPRGGEDGPPAEDDAPVAIGAAAGTAPGGRPHGRIRPGVGPGTAPAAPVVPWRAAVRPHPGWLAAAVLAVAAAGAVVWALILQGRLDDQREQIRAQNQELQAQQALIDRIRTQANASAYTLVPTAEGPAEATGRLLFSPQDRSGALLVRGLTPLPPDRAYQIWYVSGEGPQPGPTFKVDERGEGVLPITVDVQPFDQVALTAEPASGSQTPTSAIVLAGEIGGAAGALPGGADGYPAALPPKRRPLVA